VTTKNLILILFTGTFFSNFMLHGEGPSPSPDPSRCKTKQLNSKSQEQLRVNWVRYRSAR